MNTLELIANDCQIEIDISDPDWAKCFLRREKTVVFLGAETAKYLKTHLLEALRSELPSGDHAIDTSNYSWVLSLAEAHHTLYTAPHGNDRLFMWQDANAKEICIIQLSKHDCDQWLSQIEALGEAL